MKVYKHEIKLRRRDKSNHLIDKLANLGDNSKLFADPHSIKTGLAP